MMGMDVGDVNVGYEGHLEDMLPFEAAELEGMGQLEAFGPSVGTAGNTVPWNYAPSICRHVACLIDNGGANGTC